MNAVLAARVTVNPHWLILLFFINAVLSASFLLINDAYTELALYFAVYLNILLIAFTFRRSQEPLDVLEPGVVFILLYTLYSWSAAWHVVCYDRDFDVIMRTYYLCVIVGLVGFLAGYKRFKSARERLVKGFESVGLDVSYKAFFRALLFAAIFFALINFDALINTFNVSNIRPYTETALRPERTALSGPSSFLYELSLILIFATILFWPLVNKKFSFISFIPFGVFAIISVMGGSKGPLISVITVFLIYYNYKVRRLPILPTVAIFMSLLVFATMINHVRNTTSLVEMYYSAVDYIKYDPTILLPLNNGEFSGPPQTLLNVIKAIDSGSLNYSFGYTWLTETLVFVPKALFPNRPLPMSELYISLFLPGAQAGTGEAWFIPTEGFWAFGFLGVFLVMTVYGFVASCVYKFFKDNSDNCAVLLVYSFLFFPLITTAIRTGLFGTIKSSIMLLAPFALIFLLSRKRTSADEHNHTAIA